MSLSLGQLAFRRRRQRRICTGQEALDSSLGGDAGWGLAPCSLTELTGPPGTGKSAIALALVLDTVRSGYTAVWVSCALRPFPYERFRQLAGYRSEFDRLVKVVYMPKIEDVAFFSPRHTLVVLDHYDSLATVLPRPCRERAIAFLIKTLSRWARTRCVVCTATSLPRVENYGERRKFSPSLLHLHAFRNVRRIQIYRDDNGVRVTSSMARFDICSDGLCDAPFEPPQRAAATDAAIDCHELTCSGPCDAAETSQRPATPGVANDWDVPASNGHCSATIETSQRAAASNSAIDGESLTSSRICGAGAAEPAPHIAIDWDESSNAVVFEPSQPTSNAVFEPSQQPGLASDPPVPLPHLPEADSDQYTDADRHRHDLADLDALLGSSQDSIVLADTTANTSDDGDILGPPLKRQCFDTQLTDLTDSSVVPNSQLEYDDHRLDW